MQEIVEAPLDMSWVHFGHAGESLPALLVAARKGGMNPGSNWYRVDGWVTQFDHGAVFRCPRWPRGGFISPSAVFRHPFVVAAAHEGPMPSWKGFQAGIMSSRVACHFVCIDTSKRV